MAYGAQPTTDSTQAKELAGKIFDYIEMCRNRSPAAVSKSELSDLIQAALDKQARRSP